MRIGILTFHRSYNYGAMLQAWSLKKVLTDLGHKVSIIDAWDPPVFIKWKYGIPCVSGRWIRNKLGYILNNSQIEPFSKFLKENLTPSLPFCRNNSDATILTSYYDAFICGSDQIWNPRFTRGFNPLYFLDFAKNAAVKRIAYAASFGANEEVSPSDYTTLKSLLIPIDFISVREPDAVNLIHDITQKPAICVLDPTLLLTAEQYFSIMRKPKGISTDNFILMYSVKKNHQLEQLTAKVAARSGGAKIITLHAPLRGKCDNSGVGPAEFLWLLSHAKSVVTSSFHGTALSVLFHKPFIASTPPQGAIRITGLLNQLGLDSQWIGENMEDTNGLLSRFTTDFSKSDLLLTQRRESSIQFLKNALR